MRVGVAPEETAVLVGWRRRSDNHVLVRMKAEAVLHASRGVDVGIIAETVERTERGVQEWPAEWRGTRMRRVPAGHAGNRDAAEPARAQRQEPKAVLARPSSRTGARAGFRDAPALREVVRILFGAEHQSDSSHRLLPPLCGPSPEPPDPFDEHRDEPATTRRAAWATTRVKALLDAGWKVHTARRGPPRARGPDPPHAAPKRTAHQTVRGPEEDVPVLLRRPLADQQKVTPYPTEGNQNTWQTILALERLQRETETEKIAVVLDNARFHHAKALTGLYEPGQLLDTPIYLPPYAPDHNPAEHVWNAAKSNIANIQRETPEETFGAFASYVTGRAFDYDFEHLPLRETRNDFVS